MPRILAFLVVLGLAFAGYLLFFLKPGSSGVRTEVGADDPVLIRLRASSPTLKIEKRLDDDFNRVPVYWVVDSTSARGIPLPRSLAEEDSVVVEFVSCDTASVPARLKYPDAPVTACVRVTSADHVLEAFAFHAKGRLDDLMTFYDGPGTGRRLDHRYAEESGRDGVLSDGSRGFLYSYFLVEGGEGASFVVDAFVGYRRTRR